MPKLDGISFCHQLRASGYTVPVLLMTAENTQASKIAGLDAGADDYVIKPLDLSELLARMRALLRRGQTEPSPLLSWDTVTLNPSSCEVFCLGQRLNLTSKEYELLELLLRHQYRIFSLNSLMERLWTYEKMPSENALRSHVKSLRRKLRLGGAKPMIETVYGLGYRLKPLPVASEPSLSPPSLGTLSPVPQGPIVDHLPVNQDRVLTPLKDIWVRHQQKYLALIDALDQVVTMLKAEHLDSALDLAHSQLDLVNAQKSAHKLKGALGSFGFTTASQLAAQIEQLLLVTPAPELEHIQQLPGLVQQLRQALQMPAKLPSHGQRPRQQPDSLIYQWLIIDNDPLLIETLIHEAFILGIQTHIATTLDEATQLLKQHSVDVVMVDVNCSTNVNEGLAWLSDLSRQQPSLQVIVATDKDGLIDRVNLLRAGASAFLQKPVMVAQVLETVTHSLAQATLPAARILALDDDPVILACLKTLLMPWGFQLTLVSNPMEFWDSLDQNPPDLMIWTMTSFCFASAPFSSG
ncbi:response regulator [Leptothoe sp. PORK10 BA2]|uniref:response regulator n=1 Tax=Leptothoe sp. PORK10 BA2 TaxID=3110254 RepID=UPI002B21D2F0|nr:response regulator [Leptothoe sp. PORK10 BA2]MEA5464781.1 response regulator [Leptothoe sp. PORK10 BA2]